MLIKLKHYENKKHIFSGPNDKPNKQPKTKTRTHTSIGWNLFLEDDPTLRKSGCSTNIFKAVCASKTEASASQRVDQRMVPSWLVDAFGPQMPMEKWRFYTPQNMGYNPPKMKVLGSHGGIMF